MTQVFLVDRNIELSNLDALFDRSRQSLIWEGLLIITSLNEQTHDQF